MGYALFASFEPPARAEIARELAMIDAPSKSAWRPTRAPAQGAAITHELTVAEVEACTRSVHAGLKLTHLCRVGSSGSVSHRHLQQQPGASLGP